MLEMRYTVNISRVVVVLHNPSADKSCRADSNSPVSLMHKRRGVNNASQIFACYINKTIYT